MFEVRRVSKIFKKLISVILCITVVVSTFILGDFSGTAAAVDGTDIPLIYVQGTGMPLFVKDENGEEKEVYPVTVPDGFIDKTVKENMGIFAKAALTQKWEEFGKVLAKSLGEIYGILNLDEHGKTQNGVYLRWTWNKEKLNPKKSHGKYPTQRFTFNYDWRLDPYENADLLHQFIEDVREVTGEDKVGLSGRCLGSCITMAYMEKYDAQYISDYILYASALDGATQCSKCFAGEMYLDPDGVERFMYDLQLSDDDVTNQLIQSFVTVFNRTYGLDITCAAVNNVLKKKYLEFMPDAMMSTFGTFPGYWSMVNDRDYERAKDNVFHNVDKEKYADFIKMIDDYHYNVQVKSNELLKEYADRGINVANITKYGYQTIPITGEADMISDKLCSVYDASKGATTATLVNGFDNNYIEAAKENGTYKYISPDLQIDASTCLFPEKTWFVKNIEHKKFPKAINRLIDEIVNNEDFTVFSDPELPQYLFYDIEAGEITPLVAENMNTDARYHVSFFDAWKRMWKCIFELIKRKFQTVEPAPEV